MRFFPFICLCWIATGIVMFPMVFSTKVMSAVAVDVVQDGGETETVELYSESHALVIGIDNYADGWPLLSNAVQDAKAVAAALEARGFDVTLEVNLNRRDMIDALRNFFILKGNNPDARLFLWFAGHGHTENNEGFIIPSDGAVPEDGPKFRLTAIPMRDISTYVRLAQSKHVMTVFDSCFSGTIFSTSRSKPPKVISMASLRPVRQFLTSGDAFQQVSDDGTFRELFLSALNGDEAADLNGDGFVTGTELGFFMTDRITNLTEGRQTPRYGKLRDKEFDRGDFVFTSLRPKRPTKRQSAPEVPANLSSSQTNAPNLSLEMENTFWASIQDSKDWRSYQAYVDRFGESGAFTTLAVLRINKYQQEEKNGWGEGLKSPVDPSANQAVELVFWKSIADSSDWRAYQAYIEKYGKSGQFYILAQQRFDQHKKVEWQKSLRAPQQTEVALLSPTRPTTPSQTATQPSAEGGEQKWKAIEASMRMTRQNRWRAQHSLTALGHSTRGVDGMFGKNSRKAIASYQRSKGLRATGYLNGPLYQLLMAEAPPPPAPLYQPRQQAQKRYNVSSAPAKQTESSNDEPSLGTVLDNASKAVNVLNGLSNLFN